MHSLALLAVKIGAAESYQLPTAPHHNRTLEVRMADSNPITGRNDRACAVCGTSIAGRQRERFCSRACLVAPAAKEARFWSHVNKDGPIPLHRPDLGPCWLWNGAKGSDGYGLLRVRGRGVRAHRMALEFKIGEPLGERQALHHCDTPLCVNNEGHLFLGSSADNVADCVSKGRQARGDTSGPRLHPERMARGDRNGLRLHPERRAWGERNGSKTHPERVPRGDRTGARTHPERRPRGDRNGSRTCPEARPRGEAHGMSKLTDNAVRTIRAAYAAGGITHRELAERFGVGRKQVTAVLAGRGWRHVTPESS